MLRLSAAVLALGLALAGCASFYPSPQAMQAVSIQGTPGKAVIYLVRGDPDLSIVAAQIALDGELLGTSYAGTYFRVEVPAGRHRFSGYGVDGGNITLDVQADRVYFVQQYVAGIRRSPTSLTSSYKVIDETKARATMVGASRAG